MSKFKIGDFVRINDKTLKGYKDRPPNPNFGVFLCQDLLLLLVSIYDRDSSVFTYMYPHSYLEDVNDE